ncbi:MAG TPA: DUF4350 domain-containing protein [Planctomycetota bacterium]|nr:DUF4350 domain-containing protein [Planctomycetota bacterium]
MPERNRKTDLIILAGLALLSVFIILMMSVRGASDRPESVIRSTFSSMPHGTMACFELFRRLGIPAKRLSKPPDRESLANAGVLFILDPRKDVEGDDLEHLGDWVRRGGVLVCTRIHSLQFFHQIEPPSSEVRHRYFVVSEGDTTHPAPGENPLARDVSAVVFDSRDQVKLAEKPKAVELLPPVERLFTDSAGCRVARRGVGRGSVILLADGSFLSNRAIGREDNAVLAMNLLEAAQAQAGPGDVVFDEYHLGFGSHPGAWGTMLGLLTRTSPGWAVLSLTAAGLLAVVCKGRQFGSRITPERRRRRSKLEFVHAVGATCRTAGAHRLAFGVIFKWFRRRVAARLGLLPSAADDAIAARLARHTGKPGYRYTGVFRRCREALAAPAIPARAASALLNELAEVESEAFDGNPPGK